MQKYQQQGILPYTDTLNEGANRNEPYLPPPMKPAPPCPICKGAGFTRLDVPVGHPLPEIQHTRIPLFHLQEVTLLTSSPVSSHSNLPNRGRSKASAHHATLIEITTINTHRVQRCDAACFLLLDGEQVVLFAPTAYHLLVILLEHLGEAVPFEELVARTHCKSG